MKKLISVFMAFVLTFAVSAPITAETAYDDFFEIIDSYNINDAIPSYYEYLNLYPDVRPDETITVGICNYTSYTENGVDTHPVTYYLEQRGTCILSDEDSAIEFEFTIPETGFYNLSMEYRPTAGKSSPIQRGVFIDGELPFKEFALVEFYRLWQPVTGGSYHDAQGVSRLSWETDNQGNDLKPTVVETPDWIDSYFYDSSGYVLEELAVYLEAGAHTITLVALREPVLINNITFSNTINRLSYAEKKSEWDAAGAKASTGQIIRIEAENAAITSSQMLYPAQDQSSPAVYPSSAKLLLNNSIGGKSWGSVGQWIEWEFTAPEAGYYNIALHLKQNFQRGIPVTRKIFIDGEVPFEEFSGLRFSYAQNWRTDILKDKANNPYMIYLDKGPHTIRMEAVLGDFAETISLMQETLYELNAIYRKVITILGVKPDKYRDYQIERNIPGLRDELISARDKLNTVIDTLREAAPETSDKAAVLLTMRDQLNDLIKDQERFTKTTEAYRLNSRACGTWITQVLSQPLQLDAIYVYSPGADVNASKPGWWQTLWFEIKKLFYSFIIDYNKIGNVSDDKDAKTITLWIGTGRDQANIIKSLIDKSFTNTYGVNVNVMIVDMSTLLQATLAGQGPDVAIQVANDVPMNYGLRNAVTDLSIFPDLAEVEKRFYPSALTGLKYDGHTFGLPETQTFPMMFYRKDIMRDLEFELPDTWDDVLVLMTVLAKNRMEFGMFPLEPLFATILYQNGGSYYTADATKSALDSEEGINAFKIYCNYYTDYKLDKITSVEERFRTGECPVIISDYTFYNNLQVSAPDLKGLWGFAPVPATVREDGALDRTVASTGLACVIMNASKDKRASWEFLKWWTSAETQTNYGREMESLLGASARVATANIEAFSTLPWPKKEYEALNEQFKTARGIEQVPGGYFTFRNVDNAFYRVTESASGSIKRSVSPREELTDKVILINDEIRYKRIEFGMPLGDNK